MHSFQLSRQIAVLALLCCVALTGCGRDVEPEDPSTGFERALARVGEGVSPTGTGFGWIDLDTARSLTGSADALGPGPEDFVRSSDLLEAVGVDTSNAEAATSIAASYGYAVRLDGVDAGRLPRLLEAAGATSKRVGDWTNYDLGDQWEAPLMGPLSVLRDFASRVAVGPDGVILSRTGSARRALQDAGRSPLEEPANAFAAECLGGVSSARTLLGTFTHNPFASPDLIAIGVRPKAPAREVLCAIGDSVERAEEWVRRLSESFSAGAREPLSGEPISRSVSEAQVDELDEGGFYAARVEITLAEGEHPGFLYGALVRGSVLPFLGAPKPIPDGTQLRLRVSPAPPP